MAWRFELTDSPFLGVQPKAKPRANVSLEKVISNRINTKQNEVKSYYNPMIYEIEEQIQELQLRKQELVAERDESLKRIEESENFEEKENMCGICCVKEATVKMQCGHFLCTVCVEKVDYCPYDRFKVK